MIRKPGALQKIIHLFIMWQPVTALIVPGAREAGMKRALILVMCLCTFACSQSPALTPTALLDSDVEMEAAYQKARVTLDVFIQKIGTPHPDRTFVAVKVRFSPPDVSTQDIWVAEVTYTGGSFRALMGDDIPSSLKSFQRKKF